MYKVSEILSSERYVLSAEAECTKSDVVYKGYSRM